MKTSDIRSAYLKFFESHGHRICASDSLVPGNDPTLLFTGAGMNQFKDQFMGIGKIEFRRATTAQKCIRTGDIMNVGVTSSHHTMFEMMGNFSFGDYFKHEAIEWAWEFLTGVMKIPENRLQVTVFHNDDEAFNAWHQKIGLPANLISRLGEHDNFWPADAPTLGPNGPCGPCSEIFYDRGEAYGCGKSDCGVTCPCRRWVEIWNLVFTQFDRQSDGSLPPLPQKNIDTGMGLERMAACMQNVPTNMDIDIFQPLVQAVAQLSGKTYGAARPDDVLMRRVADHIRAVTFCINDGVLPANTHRGYVLKRLLRRAVIDGRNLGIENAFLYHMVPVVGQVMGDQYPEVKERAASIADQVHLEEDKFLATLGRGLTLIDMAVDKAKQEKRSVIDGDTAFELYDTYGFPYEVAEEVVARESMTLDRKGFDAAMERAREKAREGAKMKGDVFARGPMTEVKQLTAETAFVGYDELEGPAKVIAIVAGDALVQTAGPDTEVSIILDRTGFYAESGGQVGDTGSIVGAGNLVIEIIDTQKLDGIFIHVGRVESGTVTPGMAVSFEVNSARRKDITRNHTSTHILHWALREVLGDKAEQKGSWVGPERSRFDFQHNKGMSDDEIAQVEDLVNQRILQNAGVSWKETDIESARAAGAMALFGEKYGATVRLVSVGDFSRELCGGCHAQRTGDLGLFRILTETSVASGVRRIEACTGMAAVRLTREEGRLLTDLAQGLKVPARELSEKIAAMQQEEKSLRKELAAFREEQLLARLATLENDVKHIGDVPYLTINLGDIDGKELRTAGEAVKRKFTSGVALLGAASEGKVSLLCLVSKDLIDRGIKAGELIASAAEMVGGKGGGKPDMAQAGGKDAEKLPDALMKLPEFISSAMS